MLNFEIIFSFEVGFIASNPIGKINEDKLAAEMPRQHYTKICSKQNADT